MVPESGASAIWDGAGSRPEMPRHGAKCPECHNEMRAVPIPFRGRHVELDVCRPCQRLWLDRQEDNAVLSVDPDPGPAQAIARRRSWFTRRGERARNNDERQREAIYGIVLRRGEHRERESLQHWESNSLLRALVVGVVVFIVSSPLPTYIAFRLAAVAALVYFTLRRLRR
jgi:Zn-finger nucleic acid-binding protein